YFEFQFEANTVSTSYEKYGVFSNDIRVSSTNFENESITGDKLSDASIVKTKADFIQESNNLFNVNNIEYDVLLGLDGSLTTSTNYIKSDYILVNEGETYTTNEKYFVYVIYDRFKNMITGRGQDLANVTIPSNGHYIRLSILNKWLPNFKFYNNKVSTVGSYNIDFKNKPVITENFNEKTIFNKSSYNKYLQERDFEIVEIFKNDSDFKSPSGRLIDSFERTYKDNVKSFRMNTLGNATAEMQIILSESIPLKGMQEFNLIVYIEDATKLKHIQLIVNKEGGGSW